MVNGMCCVHAIRAAPLTELGGESQAAATTSELDRFIEAYVLLPSALYDAVCCRGWPCWPLRRSFFCLFPLDSYVAREPTHKSNACLDSVHQTREGQRKRRDARPYTLILLITDWQQNFSDEDKDTPPALRSSVYIRGCRVAPVTSYLEEDRLT
jgi:hypothetical protein